MRFKHQVVPDPHRIEAIFFRLVRSFDASFDGSEFAEMRQ
jgi:hypothetical protein